MWRAVINQDNGRWQRERASEDLHQEHARKGQPNEDAGRLRWRHGAAGDDGQVGCEAVSNGETEDTPPVAPQRAESGIDARVDEELKDDSYTA